MKLYKHIIHKSLQTIDTCLLKPLNSAKGLPEQCCLSFKSTSNQVVRSGNRFKAVKFPSKRGSTC